MITNYVYSVEVERVIIKEQLIKMMTIAIIQRTQIDSF